MIKDKPMFNYVSKCCEAKATKPPCVKSEKKDSTLGTWTCSKCGKTCSCYRHIRRDDNAN